MDIREFVKNPIQDAILHPWESARIAVVSRLLNKYINKKNNLNIIDIGCGDAKVIDKLSDEIIESNFIGIDTALDDDLINQLNTILKKPNIQLLKSSNDLTNQKLNADIVLLLDIIEHIDNDIEFLKEVASSKFISSDTHIIITVPAFQSLFVNRDTWLGHFRRYTVKSLSKVAMENSLKIVTTGYFFTSLLPIRFLQKLIEKKNDTADYQGINNWEGSKWSANLLKSILMLDFQIGYLFTRLGIRLPGLSCYMICKKQ